MATKVDKFDYNLPKELIALYPASKRDKCRLMVVDTVSRSIQNHIFSDIVNLLDDTSFLVVNNTKVRNARLHAKKVTGGASEVFVTDVMDNTHFKGLVRGKFKSGDKVIAEGVYFTLLEKLTDGLWIIQAESDIEKIMQEKGHVPLPPYIDRMDTQQDKEDYQTVYAKYTGSSAAPTAGLHFTNELLSTLKDKGVEIIELTLDVGLGTFRPVKTEYMEDHEMHYERYFISDEAAEKINTLKSKGKKLTAVGSTSVRALETAADDKGIIKAGENSSNIFIMEPYNFKIVDNMITNFHLPKSTLLAMVTALGGYDLIMQAYHRAVQENYRFFSYGDAMYIKRK